MKIYKDYLLIVPIVAVGIYFAFAGAGLLKDAAIARKLEVAITKQNSLKDITKDIFSERNISIRYLKKEADSIDLEKQRSRSDESIRKFKSLYVSKDDASQFNILANEIYHIREFIAANETIQDAKLVEYLGFLEKLNELIIQNYKDIEQNYFPEEIKAYLKALNSIYTQMLDINKNNTFIQTQLNSKAEPNIKDIQEQLNFENDETSGFMLQKQIMTPGILAILNSEELKEIDAEIDEIKFELANNIITDKIETLNTIYNLQIKRYIILNQISNIIEKNLDEKNRDYYTKIELKIPIFMGIFALLLFISFSLSKKLMVLNKAKSIALTNTKIARTDNKDEVIIDTLHELIEKIVSIQSTLDRINLFNSIKNSYLGKISSNYQNLVKQNLQSLIFLRKSATSKEQIKIINSIENNSSLGLANFDALFTTINMQDEEISTTEAEFNPQQVFEGAINSTIEEIEAKGLNFINYIDPLFVHVLIGDEAKLKAIISNLIIAATMSAAKNSKLQVIIKRITDVKDASSINISVNIKSFELATRQNEILTDSVKMRADIAKTFLNTMHSDLVMQIEQGVEFNFTLKLNLGDHLVLPEPNKNLHILYIQSGDEEYDEIMDLTLKRMNLNFETTFESAKKIREMKYDIAFMRHTKKLTGYEDLKNLTILKDPLMPNQITSSIIEFEVKEDKNSFMLKKPRILLLDENLISLSMLRLAFENFDIELTSLSDTKNFLNSVAQDNFDAIFIDCDISNISPIDLAKRCKELELHNKLEHASIIAIVSNTSEISIDEIKNNTNFADAIKKPISLKNLQSLLEKLIENFEIFIKKRGGYEQNTKILIYKKTPVQNQIYQGALKEFSITAVNNIDEFQKELKQNAYRIVMIDDDADGFDENHATELVLQARELFNVNTNLFIFSMGEIGTINAAFTKVFKANISKSQIEQAVRKEFNIDSMVSSATSRERERERERRGRILKA